jgi:hypothetical protein
MGIVEVGENILLLLFERDFSDDDHDRDCGAQEVPRPREEEEEVHLQLEDAANVTTPVVQDDRDETALRCRRCRWDRPEAWLVQSDSVDEEVVSVAAAMA